MNNMKQFLVDSITLDFAEKMTQLSLAAQQQVTLKLAEMYMLFGEMQKAHDLAVTLRDTTAQLIRADVYAAKGDTTQAVYMYFKAFAAEQSPEVYRRLATLFENVDLEEDAAYYVQLAEKLTAYRALTALQQNPEALEQAAQMIAHPQSFDGWLQSVLRLNEEELATYAEQAVAPILEEKRPIRKQTLQVTAAKRVQPVVSSPKSDVASIGETFEDDVLLPMTPSVIQPPMTQQVTPSQQQPSPYVDPATFIAMQEATRNEKVQKEQSDDDLNDFESMYFGDMYDD